MGKLTDLEINEICSLYQKGVSIRKISKQFGVNREVVRNRLKKRGIYIPKKAGNQNPITEEEKQNIIKLYLESHSSLEVAKKVNRSSARVCSVIKAAGINPQPSGKGFKEYYENLFYDETLPRINRSIELYNRYTDWSFDEIAAVVYGHVDEKDMKQFKIDFDKVKHLIAYRGFSFRDEFNIEKKLYNETCQVKKYIGEHLMKLCRVNEECAFKPLLPEYKGEKS